MKRQPATMPGDSKIQDHATEFFDDAEAMAIEDTIWWARGRRAIIERYLDRAKRHAIGGILEIGCGSGGDLSLLSRYGPVWGLERSAVLAARARRRGVAAGVHEVDFFDHPIDPSVNLFCLFDVLEHIEDDEAFVRRLATKVTGDHLLLLSVPACQFLFGPHDVKLHHYRRYSRRQLESLLQRHGYEVLHAGYFMCLLFPLAVGVRWLETIKARLSGSVGKDVEIGQVPRPINALFTRMLQLEATLSRFVRFPIGLWVFTLARRKAD